MGEWSGANDFTLLCFSLCQTCTDYKASPALSLKGPLFSTVGLVVVVLCILFSCLGVCLRQDLML